MTDYYAGHVKREPGNGLIALRTTEAEPVAGQEVPFGGHRTWMVIGPFGGPMYMLTPAVDSWDDIYTAGPPA